MLTLLDHLLFVTLALLFPLRAATAGYRRLGLAPWPEVPRVRRLLYRQAVVLQWSLAAVVLGLWLVRHRPWTLLGVVPQPTIGLLGAALGLAIVGVFVLRQRRETLASDQALADVRRRLGPLERMLPRTREEMRGFVALSLTAGVCEELLYRGYLLWYLTRSLGLVQSVAVAALLFGLGHLYQGFRGMLTTGLLGAFLCGVYLITGSLYLPMVIHVVMDLHMGTLARAAFEREAAAAEYHAPEGPPEPPAGPWEPPA